MTNSHIDARNETATSKELGAGIADLNAVNERGVSALHKAAWNNNLDEARRLLEQGADPNLLTTKQEFSEGTKGLYVKGATPLHLARNDAMAELLIRHGADVNTRDPLGRTPLQWHATDYKTELVQCLIDHGAEVNVMDRCGQTPLRDCIQEGTPSTYQVMARLLIDNGADVNQGESGKPLLDVIYRDPQDEKITIASLLLEHGADVNAPLYGETPLHILLQNDPDSMSNLGRLLLKHGADLSLPDRRGLNVHELAMEKGNLEAATVLGAARREREGQAMRPEPSRSRDRSRS
jgi:ankyrin repeat protein